MPKIKTRKVASKRFKVTGTGKIIHRTKGIRHLRKTKNKARQRRTDSPKVLTNQRYINMVKSALGV